MKYKIGDVLVVDRRKDYYKIVACCGDEYMLIYYKQGIPSMEFQCSVEITEEDVRLATKVEILLFAE